MAVFRAPSGRGYELPERDGQDQLRGDAEFQLNDEELTRGYASIPARDLAAIVAELLGYDLLELVNQLSD